MTKKLVFIMVLLAFLAGCASSSSNEEEICWQKKPTYNSATDNPKVDVYQPDTCE